MRINFSMEYKEFHENYLYKKPFIFKSVYQYSILIWICLEMLITRPYLNIAFLRLNSNDCPTLSQGYLIANGIKVNIDESSMKFFNNFSSEIHNIPN